MGIKKPARGGLEGDGIRGSVDVRQIDRLAGERVRAVAEERDERGAAERLWRGKHAGWLYGERAGVGVADKWERTARGGVSEWADVLSGVDCDILDYDDSNVVHVIEYFQCGTAECDQVRWDIYRTGHESNFVNWHLSSGICGRDWRPDLSGGRLLWNGTDRFTLYDPTDHAADHLLHLRGTGWNFSVANHLLVLL